MNNHFDDDMATTATESLSDDDPNAPMKQEFMVSFLVDARGGAMTGCRYSGVKVCKFCLGGILCVQFCLGAILSWINSA